MSKVHAKVRVPEVDILRAWCCLAVLVMHSLAVVTPPDAGAGRFTGAGWAYQLLLWATPTFAVLSGFVLTHGYRDDQQLRSFYRKKLVAVVLPFAGWTLVYLAIFGEAVPSGEFALRLPLGLAGQRHLYFLGMVAQFYLLFPCLRPLLTRAPYPTLAASLAITLLWQGVFTYLPAPHGWETFWRTSHGLLPAWGVFLAAGAVLALRHDRLTALFERHRWGAVVLAAVALAVLLTEFRLYAPELLEYNSHRPMAVLSTLALLPLLWLLGRRAAEAGWHHRLRGVAAVSFGVYLVHPLALWPVSLVVPAHLSPWLRVPLMALGCAALTGLILTLARLHPWSARLTGIPPLPPVEMVRIVRARLRPNRARGEAY